MNFQTWRKLHCLLLALAKIWIHDSICTYPDEIRESQYKFNKNQIFGQKIFLEVNKQLLNSQLWVFQGIDTAKNSIKEQKNSIPMLCLNNHKNYSYSGTHNTWKSIRTSSCPTSAIVLQSL